MMNERQEVEISHPNKKRKCHLVVNYFRQCEKVAKTASIIQRRHGFLLEQWDTNMWPCVHWVKWCPGLHPIFWLFVIDLTVILTYIINEILSTTSYFNMLFYIWRFKRWVWKWSYYFTWGLAMIGFDLVLVFVRLAAWKYWTQFTTPWLATIKPKN